MLHGEGEKKIVLTLREKIVHILKSVLVGSKKEKGRERKRGGGEKIVQILKSVFVGSKKERDTNE